MRSDLRKVLGLDKQVNFFEFTVYFNFYFYMTVIALRKQAGTHKSMPKKNRKWNFALCFKIVCIVYFIIGC